MTLHLIDANVLIRAHGDHYPIDRIKPFWEWLVGMAGKDRVKAPREIDHEVAKSADLLGQWLRQPEVRKAIILPDATNGATVAEVIAKGYAPDLNDIELENIGRDPFLIAAALGGVGRVVVTRESFRPSVGRLSASVTDRRSRSPGAIDIMTTE
jgi:hypothetical protein